MKCLLKTVFLILGLVVGSILVSCGAGTTESGNPTGNSEDGAGDSADAVDEEQACVDQGGEFVEFSNSCADKCDADAVCTDAITDSCDCGEGLCWNVDTYECEED